MSIFIMEQLAYDRIQRIEHYMFHKETFMRYYLMLLSIKIIAVVTQYKLVFMQIRFMYGMMVKCQHV